MQSRVLYQALARINSQCEDILGDLHRRGIRFPTGKVNNVVMRMFEDKDLQTVRFVLLKHGLQERRAKHEGEQFFTDGAREVVLYTKVPEYYTGLVGLVAN